MNNPTTPSTASLADSSLHTKPARVLLHATDNADALFQARRIAAKRSSNIQHVDLSHIVSDYLRETEKKMLAIMDTAEESGASLFFDEADALFAKSSAEVSSSDRQNLDVPFFLQCIENYPGTVVIASLRPEILDQAALNRLGFVLDKEPQS